MRSREALDLLTMLSNIRFHEANGFVRSPLLFSVHCKFVKIPLVFRDSIPIIKDGNPTVSPMVTPRTRRVNKANLP